MLMIETILIIWLGVTNIAFVVFFLMVRSRFAALLYLCETLVKAIRAQRQINETQTEINDNIGQNLEILGVHTKLIPPSIAMQAEAFLAWYNKRKEEKDG